MQGKPGPEHTCASQGGSPYPGCRAPGRMRLVGPQEGSQAPGSAPPKPMPPPRSPNSVGSRPHPQNLSRNYCLLLPALERCPRRLGDKGAGGSVCLVLTPAHVAGSSCRLDADPQPPGAMSPAAAGPWNATHSSKPPSLGRAGGSRGLIKVGGPSMPPAHSPARARPVSCSSTLSGRRQRPCSCGSPSARTQVAWGPC